MSTYLWLDTSQTAVLTALPVSNHTPSRVDNFSKLVYWNKATTAQAQLGEVTGFSHFQYRA